MSATVTDRLDTSNLRYWRQNAQLAVRDVIDALIEVITNADDRYQILRSPGRIEIEVERRRGAAQVLRVRDFADGMTLETMRRKLGRLAGRVSGMEEGHAVRGTNSRGAKDIAILGKATFESIAGDKCYHRFVITSRGEILTSPSENVRAKHRERLGIPRGTGTLVTIEVDRNRNLASIPRHDKLKETLSRLVPLRDILSSPDREVFLKDVNHDRTDRISAIRIDGHERVKKRLSVPGYPVADAKLIIKRAKQRFEDRRPLTRPGGILIKSRHAIHEATLFDPELERDPCAAWFYGKLTCDYIDELSDAYEERWAAGKDPNPENPCGIVDPLRKQGLIRQHPFVKALFAEALKELRPLVEDERKHQERERARVENAQTRKRLDKLQKEAAKFMDENIEEPEASRNPDRPEKDGVFKKKGYGLNPAFAQIVLGHSERFWFNVRQETFPEISVGDTVEVSCEGNEIVASARTCPLERHPAQDGILRCIFSVRGLAVTKASAVTVRIGPIVAQSLIEVLESEKNKYDDVVELCFNQKRYTLHPNRPRSAYVLAPCPSLVSARTPFKVTCSDPAFRIVCEPGPELVPFPELGIAKCKLRLWVPEADRRATLTAEVDEVSCKADVVSTEPRGAEITIKIKDEDYGNQRAIWRGNVLKVAARHPAIERYIGPKPDFPGQEEKHFRAVLAEIVAEAVCTRVLARNAEQHPEEYKDLDVEGFYAEHSKLMCQFLPVAHSTQVPDV